LNLELLEMSIIEDSNILSSFLAARDLPSLDATTPTDFHAIVVCGSAVLATVEAAVAALKLGVAPRVLFSGGVGHSTPLLYDAVKATPHGSAVPTDSSPSEAVVLRDYALALGAPPASLLVETASTNCGSNAGLSRATLEAAGVPHPHKLLIIQDPTMQLRTHASFRKVYSDAPGATLVSWAPFVPTLTATTGEVDPQGVWEKDRYLALLLGEIPRLKDAPGGYGPRGSGFIAHVDIPEDVIAAHDRLSKALEELKEARAVKQ
jgi:uncharacterized SAM-binding protein YcdF (DUF218 family)